MWNVYTALKLIEDLKVFVEQRGFSIGLTGGVLFNGGSTKDVDLIFYPLKDIKTDYEPMLYALAEKLNFKSIVAVNHGPNSKLIFTVKLNDDKRLDLFFPCTNISERTDSFNMVSSNVGESGATK